ncbi:MFS transporter [Mycobacterium sp. ITM-2016-00317]|uniref:MFS transporter n=1 Tax=Mycobacterium sp. ITM-2016-00317 TaxID=2099694 RepID=UPI000D48D551|nr:MFS transporter [Mycobacterium sp. ITM-2016-00317]WNG87554.1 MFS transporter [Mycobacterium sp. ITM-2016-00317]
MTADRTFYSLIAAGTALIGCCYGFARFAYGLFVPVFTDEFQLSSTVIGLIGSGSYVGYCAAITVALVFSDRVGARRMAVAAGVVATVGIVVVAVAPSAPVLAAGILLAGMSTGLASPPLATALAQRLSAERADRAQTIVNAGTGIGVVVSGPIAFALFDHWRVAWGTYGVLTVAVTVWVAFTLRNGPAADRGVRRDRRLAPGTARLLTASVLAGLGSIAIWNFGRDLISTSSGGDAVATSAWMLLGAAGIIGALGGSAVQRLGFRPTWVVTVSAMSAGTALLAVSREHTAGVLLSAGMFGAAYIGLTGLLLLWSTRLYPDSAAFGVGMSFFAIAAGQAIGAPVVGALIQSFGYTAAFLVFAVVGLMPAILSPASARTAPGAGVTARR